MTIVAKDNSNQSFIDYELSKNLDSTNAFEGPEKLLEIWFFPNAKSIPDNKTLRNGISIDEWIEILKLVNCSILSYKKFDKFISFLLSESSLFVYDYKIILKTCGTTTTLFCLDKIFEKIQLNFTNWYKLIYDDNNEKKYEVFKVFYSRRQFFFPNKQKSIHKKWEDEVKYLNNFFKNGQDMIIGDKEDGWNLYYTDSKKMGDMKVEDDETFEILMTELNSEKVGKYFYKKSYCEDNNKEEHEDGHILGKIMTEETKIDKIYGDSKDMAINQDSFAFQPCGYSCNIIYNEEYYYTLHVTPEDGWSYASFESNIPSENGNGQVLDNVIDIFEPKNFSLTLFKKSEYNLKSVEYQLHNYKIVERIEYQLDDYQLLYIKFSRDER